MTLTDEGRGRKARDEAQLAPRLSQTARKSTALATVSKGVFNDQKKKNATKDTLYRKPIMTTHDFTLFSQTVSQDNRLQSRLRGTPYTLSSTIAIPCPPPMQAAPTAYFLSKRCKLCTKLAAILAPEAARG